eukprot:CAMPEP_0114508454 /NCGR_PEP_ID=MMETSP0109-20121206/12612_1 /TAXON_ID=29199 /ORGANISM="Chlorarachnion reptans, Strain CCCM449" /LENGTH=61 /DNA_ID=CAMNT_0001687395 /DNA_START=731 /DNA_END=916 /DNA_ORIENTATION=+
MKDTGIIGKFMAAADFNHDSTVTKDEWNKMYEIMRKAHGEPDAETVEYAKIVLKMLEAKKN